MNVKIFLKLCLDEVQMFFLTLRIGFVMLVIKIFMPQDFFVGKHYGTYTCKYQVTFGRLDKRGVLQGVAARDIKQLRRQ